MSYTFLDLAEEALEAVKKSMSANEMWEYAKECGLSQKVGTKGKTPWATLSAQLYTDIRDNEKSRFTQVSKRPAKFNLKKYDLKECNEAIEIRKTDKYNASEKGSFIERDLHPLLVKFLYSNPHFKCYAKTIYHETSTKKTKGYNQWLHPDIVGIYFPFKDYQGETQKLQESFKISSFKLFSFELKVKLTFTNLREYYFQAVSNLVGLMKVI